MTEAPTDIPTARSSASPAGPPRDDAPRMFDRISQRYDLLNRVLSLGLDRYWRRKLVDMLPEQPELRVLDLATGTGDVALEILHRRHAATVVGIDKAEKMLRMAEQKRVEQQGEGRLNLALADGLAIPAETNSVDAVTIAFGIRNMPDTEACLREMHRILNDGGKALILEFSLPENRLFRRLHLFYLRRVVPLVGRLLSGDSFAYRYLNQTIETYLHGSDFCAIMESAGFENASANPLSRGIVTIYEGYKR